MSVPKGPCVSTNASKKTVKSPREICSDNRSRARVFDGESGAGRAAGGVDCGPMTASDAEQEINLAARSLLRTHPRVLLAVSGGLDSMALLDAVARASDDRESVVVATFDHGTGDASKAAVGLVRRRAREFGVRLLVGHAKGLARTEAAWRNARWDFLRAAAASTCAAVVTAHTLDDHLETVVMRVLRGAGARGLAGLLATSDVARPFMERTRADLDAYARLRGLAWADDPTNLDPAFFRNRVRHDLLPALIRARPSLGNDLLEISRRAADVRAKLERAAEILSTPDGVTGGLTVRADVVAGLTPEGLAVLWPAFLARVHAVADRRGIARLVGWSASARRGASVPLSGGTEVVRRRDDFLVRRVQRLPVENLPLQPERVTQAGPWRFSPIEVTTISGRALESNPWYAMLEAGGGYVVRGWMAGDRMRANLTASSRRVARFFDDARITGPERKGWPVVVLGEEVVWIPGVRRGHAATARSGGPHVVISCERDNNRSKT